MLGKEILRQKIQLTYTDTEESATATSELANRDPISKWTCIRSRNLHRFSTGSSTKQARI